ncbi:uncharacterized protein LOC131409217 [Diceros bicornis minor]|uniref:uncharacterized protein LOC131409217 n=1 Tax=Diceros bicornis minor TaxID=77932 RepID=UPI0026F2BFA1|nr:uncharacterized protein LOC131409217 [Diceros bicornis minor]
MMPQRRVPRSSPRRSLPGPGRRRRRRRRRRGRGAHGFAGLGRPRRESPGAQRRPEPAALAAAAPAPSLGRRVTWAGRGRASPARVTLYLRPAPRATAPRSSAWSRQPTPRSRGWPPGALMQKIRSSASEHRHPGCMPISCPCWETFRCLLFCRALGREELPIIRDFWHSPLRSGVCTIACLYEREGLRTRAVATVVIIPGKVAQSGLHPQKPQVGVHRNHASPPPTFPLFSWGVGTSAAIRRLTLSSRPLLVATHAPKVGGELLLYPKILLKYWKFFSPVPQSKCWA